MKPSASSLKPFLSLILALGLGLALSACGGKKSMEGAGEDEQAGTLNSDVTRLAGEEDGTAQANFDEVERARRLAALPKGSTKAGPGKKIELLVQPGDTLWKLAARKDVYGSGWLYPIIYKANRGLIKDPNKLEAGLKLTIPRNLSSVEEEIAKEEAMTGQIMDQSPLPGSPVTTVYKPLKGSKKGGSGWLWLLLLALAAALIFFWRRMKAKQAEAA